jgi:parvulin-like peptidyl-prolyl isomerase
MAKKTKKRPPRQLTRKQRSRLQRERRMERLLIWGVTIVGVLIVGVLVYGFVVENVVKAREPVAVVSGVPIRTAEFQARVRFLRMQIQSELQYWRQQQQALDPTDADAQTYLEYIQGQLRELQGQLSPANALTIAEQALDQLIQEELVRQEAERRGITVSPQQLQQQIEQFFGYDRNPVTPTPAPTATSSFIPTGVLTLTPTSAPLPTPTPMTEQAFRQQYDAYLDSLRSQEISEQQYRSWVRASLLAEKLLEQMTAQVPPTTDQVKLRYLVTDSEEQARELAARLDAGEDFQVLLDELREDEERTAFGTELDYLPRSMLERRLGEEVADRAFDLQVGQHSQPVPRQDGAQYVIIEIVGHEDRPVDQSLRDQLGQGAFQEWLDAQQVLVERRPYDDRVPTEP